MGKKLGIKQMMQKTFTIIQGLPSALTEALGELEDCFDMIVYGKSGNGKTSFVIQIIKALVQFGKLGKILYITYEEGHGKTLQDLIKRFGLDELGNNIEFLDHATFDELFALLSKRKSHKIVVIDSIQYAAFTLDQCKKLKEAFIKGRKKKIIIYISHCDGSLPKGAVAKSIEYDANIKVLVEKNIAFVKSRFGGNKNYVVWEEGAKKKWGLKLFNKYQNR
jgi:KaiC/GvpD/RAD55 family RecA-like ATPase